MTLHVKDGGSWKQVTSLQVKDGGSWKAVSAGYVKDGGSWKQFYGSGGGGGGGGGLSVSLSPSPADGFRQLENFNGSGYVSITVSATPTGFTNPVYSWSRVSGTSGGGAFACSPTNAAVVSIGATLPVFNDFTETWRCTVTESGSPSSTAYADVVVTLRVENLS